MMGRRLAYHHVFDHPTASARSGRGLGGDLGSLAGETESCIGNVAVPSSCRACRLINTLCTSLCIPSSKASAVARLINGSLSTKSMRLTTI
jgi:hypothetical protein